MNARTNSLLTHLLAVSASAIFAVSACNAAPAKDPAVTAAQNEISTQRMSALIKDLTNPSYDGRLPGTRGDETSRDYIVALFKTIGLQPAGTQGYLQPFSTTITQPDGEGAAKNPLAGTLANTSNIIGIIPGNDPVLSKEVIIISGHRDHLGHTPGGIQYPGANDDLSGIAATIELARAFATLKSKNKRTLMFVAYGAEEQEYMGSMYQVAHPIPAAVNENIVLMITIDMIGRGFDAWSSFSQAQMDRYANTWFKEVHNHTATHEDAYSFEFPNDSSDTTFDFDAGAFAQENINTRVIGLADVPNYHRTTDTWKNMHFEPMLPVTKTIFDFLWLVDQDPVARMKL
jgi:hypothetical protein